MRLMLEEKIFIILLSEGLVANIEDSRGEEKDDKPAGDPGPALHTARLPHGQHRAVARLQEEHQPDKSLKISSCSPEFLLA